MKNRKWGLGMDEVKLGTVEYAENHFLIVMLAYLLLCAFGAFAEEKNFSEQLKANTEKNRMLSLAGIGNHFIELFFRQLQVVIFGIAEMGISEVFYDPLG